MLLSVKSNRFHFQCLMSVWIRLLALFYQIPVEMPYSNAEAYDMIAVYFQCFENAVIASREYALRYPDRRHHSRNVFVRLARRLRETGRVQPIPVPVRLRRIRDQNNTINVLAYIAANPHVSVRVISRDLGISRCTVHRILRNHRLYPYHVVLHQALMDRDFDRRLEHCHWLLNMVEENPHFLSRILWTDEATFTSSGGVNLHNMHYWSENNPHWMRQVDHQNRWSVNVWCGIVEGRIIGPFVFDGNLNGERYLQFLRHDLPPLLDDVSLETRLNLWYQHDGCPAHFSANVRDYLDNQFPNRWIGRGSLFPWPARSPDLTCLDFYLWGRIKDLVFQTRPTTRENMIARIQEAINSIDFAEIEAAVSSTRQRLNLCIQNDGRHFEHL